MSKTAAFHLEILKVKEKITARDTHTEISTYILQSWGLTKELNTISILRLVNYKVEVRSSKQLI